MAGLYPDLNDADDDAKVYFGSLLDKNQKERMCENIEVTIQKQTTTTCLKLDEAENLYFTSWFKKCDKNGDGTVDREEAAEMIREDNDIPEVVVETLIDESDRDHDGKISFDEFVNMVCRYKQLFTKCANSYVRLFVVQEGKGQKIVLKRRPTETGFYDDIAKLKWSTLGMIVISLLQALLFYLDCSYFKLYFSHLQRKQVWRYFSYMFTHNCPEHLLWTIVAQIAVGLPLEMVHGPRVLIVYCAGILGGSVIQSGIYPLEDLAGGSPGGHAIIIAHISKIVLNFREIRHPTAQLITFGTFVALNTVYNYFTYWNTSTTSYISHLGGAVCGFLLGIVILRNLRVNRTEKIIWWLALMLYVVTMVAFIVLELIRDHSED